HYGCSIGKRKRRPAMELPRLSSKQGITFACRSCPDREKATSSLPIFGEVATDAAESENLCMRGHSKRENREILLVSELIDSERSENVSDGNADMNANRKSDDSIVPAKWANKTRTLVAELVEERGSPKGNTNQKALPRTQRHNGRSIGWTVYGKYSECEFTRPRKVKKHRRGASIAERRILQACVRQISAEVGLRAPA
ncbi:hypothetical protein LCGC14_2796140, partial [marine sediment metagenome]